MPGPRWWLRSIVEWAGARWWRAVALFVFVSLLTRWLGFAVEILDVDESAHIVGAWEIGRGRLLYRDFVNNKPPLLYVFYLAAQWLGGPSLPGVRLVTALLVLPLTAWGLVAFERDRVRGVLAGLVFLLFSAAFIGHDMLAAHAEVFMVVPATWALALVATESRARSLWRLGGAGILMGIAFLFKYQVATWGVALAAAAAVACHRDRGLKAVPGALGALAVGFALPLALTYAWFASRGAARDLVYWTLSNNLAYSANPITAAEAVERAVSYALPFGLATVPLWWAAWRSFTSEGRSYRTWLLAGLLVCTVPAVAIGFRFYPHYFVQFYVPLTLAAVPALDRWLRAESTPRADVLAAWSVVVIAGFAVANPLLYFGPWRVYRETDPTFEAVGRRLSQDACAGEASVFVWGYAPPIYYYSRLPAASRFVVLAQARLTGYVSGNLARVRGPASRDGAVEGEHWTWLMDDLERRRATYIVDTAPAGIYRWNRYPLEDYPPLRDYVAKEFELVDEVAAVRLYRRVGCAGVAGRSRPHGTPEPEGP